MTIIYIVIALIAAYFLLPPLAGLVLPNSMSGKLHLRDSFKKTGINSHNIPNSCMDEIFNLSLRMAKIQGFKGVALKEEMMNQNQSKARLLLTYLKNDTFLEENFSKAEPLAQVIKKYNLTLEILTKF